MNVIVDNGMKYLIGGFTAGVIVTLTVIIEKQKAYDHGYKDARKVSEKK